MKPLPDSEELRKRLKVKHLEAVSTFEKKHKKARDFLQSKGADLGSIRHKSAKAFGASALAGALLVSHGSQKALPPPHEIMEKNLLASNAIPATSARMTLVHSMEDILPENVEPLDRQQEKSLEQVFEKILGVKARATLEGEHLNTTYGRIGAEQHLRRYPGDVNENHAPAPDEYGGDNPSEILKEGMAPGLGAWGYFAPSREVLTPDLVETEKWYAVVQTLYLPDWNTRQPHLKNWYKHRKVLIVNTENGNAVVAAIADSGPAAWTGKHYGGSPEVMDYLGGPRYKKGPTIVFFVDDPDNKVPLGPVDYSDIPADTISIAANN